MVERQAHRGNDRRSIARAVCCLLLLGGLFSASGCAAFHPIRGVPARYLPEEYRASSRAGKRTIDLSLLVRRAPDQYRVAAGDVLSVFVPGVLGRLSTSVEEAGEEPPILSPLRDGDLPSIGYPIRVRDDHTIALPLIRPLNVCGMTISEVEQAVRRAYSEEKQILQPGRDRILVSLHRPREYRVMVVRQELSTDVSSNQQGGGLNLGTSKRGVAREVRLAAYENDVLTALTKAESANGLPGLDAENAIYVIRRRREPPIAANPPVTPPEPLPVPVESQRPPLRMSSADSLAPWPAETVHSGGIQQVSAVQSHMPIVHADSQYAPNPATAAWPPEPAVLPTAGGAHVTYGGHATFDPYAGTPAGPGSPAFPPGLPPAVPPGVSQPPALPTGPPPGYDEMPAPLPAPQIGGHAVGGGPGGYGPEGDPRWSWQSALASFSPTIDNPNVVKIPIRLGPGEYPNFREEDITLYDGDIVFIESRETEVFYTGGLLGGGQYQLPRDYDLRILDALSIAQSNGTSGATRAIGGVSALNQDVTISASHVIVLRTLPDGTRLPIEVDLERAKKEFDGRENIIIQAGDHIYLQYTKVEAIAAFIERHLLEGALFGVAAAQLDSGGN
ncbi:Polysaccharide biosynthesis/export protein [Maioricimonas rarisocia]|uniref:Polysaccharide biosynthesis/export protein n=2 Tax=Maioricimonas rarisocia TaxID=2528026 RepID=A0A517ZCV5_9PLAN|nr:Polysaccharide biosynthesis/export protein [Maioricimonas rarisocia]